MAKFKVGDRGYLKNDPKKCASINPVVANALAATARNAGRVVKDYNGKEIPEKDIKSGRMFSPYDEQSMRFKVGRVKKDSEGWWVEPAIMRGEDDWYHMSETIWRSPVSKNSAVVQNALKASVARNSDGNPESLVNWKRIYPKLKEFNNLAGWLKSEGVKLMNVARNFDDRKFFSVGHDVQSVCEWAERHSAEILNRV